jgi:hypothetical protein
MNNVVEILTRGKARIEREGWRQGPRFVTDSQLYRANGEAIPRRPGCCARDTIMIDERSNASEREAAGEVLGLALTGQPDSGLVVISWNDEAGRTVEDVYALFDKAIAMARRQAHWKTTRDKRLGEARRRAWITRRAKYGKQGHAGSYLRGAAHRAQEGAP